MAIILGSFSDKFAAPEYLHVLLNPLPVYGLLMGIIGLLIGFAMRSRQARVVALVIVLLSGLSAWPAAYFGDAAYDKIMSLSEDDKSGLRTDDDGDLWLDAHVHRAERVLPIFYALAALAAAAIFVPLKRPRSERALGILTLLLAIAALTAGGWISYAGGRIRHKEFRTEPPPPHVKKVEKSD